MPICDKGDKKEAALFSAADFLAAKNIKFPLPKTVIMAPCVNLGAAVCSSGGKTYKLMSDIDIINDDLAIMHNFALGAPLCVILAEMAAALGAENFILIGSAGALNENLTFGDRVLCRGAFCDEGTGRHYFDGEYISADKMPVLSVLPVKAEGDTWTTDALFMETSSAAAYYAEKGCLTVDMEASALFAFAKARGLKAAAMFVISDLLFGGQWRPAKKNAQTVKALRALAEEIIKKSSKNSSPENF